MIRLSVDLEEKTHRKFTKICHQKHRKKVEVIRELLEDWLKKYEK